MAKIYNSIEELIGNTPTIKLNKIKEHFSLGANIFAKLERFNPGGSSKDRVAKRILDSLVEKGASTVIEPTSGNTGIGLALLGATRDIKVVIVMPDNMSKERQLLIKAYGADLVLTDGKLGMQGAIKKAKELNDSIENSVILGQFTNEYNVLAHYESTAKEIYEDMSAQVDVFVAGIGTGGTITGVAKYLKERNKNVKIVGVEPFNSPFLTKGVSGAHNLQGIGAGFKPEILDASLIDEIITVKEQDAYELGRLLAQKEGVLAGISSGATLYASKLLASRSENAGKNIVALLPDVGDRYLSTELFNPFGD